MSNQKKVSLYNPRPASVDGDFSVHNRIYDRLWQDLTDSKMEFPEQHYLIQGVSGSGKTTLLAQLHNAMIQQPPLPSLRSLFFNEEEYSIRHLYRLWERIFELLNDQGLTANALQTRVRSQSGETEKNQDYEKNISQTLFDFLENNQFHLLLFIENFDLILQKFSVTECHRFRKILQTSSRLRIVAAATEVPASFYQYEHPFYEFFKVVHLRPLTVDGNQKLLKKLLPEAAKRQLSDAAPAIETIRRFTNGNTRCTVLLSDTLAKNNNQSASILFADLLDRLTPSYKFIMDDLPAQQQQIVEAIALNYEAIGVKKLSNKLRMESKMISAQLTQLVKNNLITKIKTSTKNNLYQLKDRLFNCWYLLRLGRSRDRDTLDALVDFTERWLQIKQYPRKHLFSEIPLLDIDTTLRLASPQLSLISPGKRFMPGRAPLRSVPVADQQLRQRGYQALETEQYRSAIQFFQKTRETDHFALAVAFHKSYGNEKQAITHYQKAAKAGQSDAFNNLGLLYLQQQQNPTAAFNALTMATKSGSSLAHYNLGLYHLQQEQDIAGAMRNFEEAIAGGNTEALLPLAQLYYHQFKKPGQAIQTLSEAADSGEPEACYHLGLIYLKNEKDEHSALHYFQKYLMHPSTQKISIPLGLTFLKYEAYDLLHDIFNEKPTLKNSALPLYYALQKCDINTSPDEILRMGPELKETVDEIMELIENSED